MFWLYGSMIAIGVFKGIYAYDEYERAGAILFGAMGFVMLLLTALSLFVG